MTDRFVGGLGFAGTTPVPPSSYAPIEGGVGLNAPVMSVGALLEAAAAPTAGLKLCNAKL